jgi:hypothetical protein
MKLWRAVRICFLICAFVMAGFFIEPAVASGTNALRIAIGPFLNSSLNESAGKLAELLPDLLAARISAQDGFQLVERSRVSEVFNELNLTANGMNSKQGMLKLGHVLACDEFVTGMFVDDETNVELWLAVVNVNDGTLADFQLLPVDVTKSSQVCGRQSIPRFWPANRFSPAQHEAKPSTRT